MLLSVDSVVIVCCLLFVEILIVSAEKIKFPDRLDVLGSELNDEDDSNDSSNVTELMFANSEDPSGIPLDVAMKLNNINSMDDFYKTFQMPQRRVPVVSAGFGSSLYGLVSKLRPSSLISGRNGSPIETTTSEGSSSAQSVLIERSAAVIQPEFAPCKPEIRAVEIFKKASRQVVRVPSCIRIERCGGCCQHELLSCQPAEEEVVNFEVNLFTYGNGGFKPIGKEIVPVKRHLRCEFKCKVKKHHCTAMQEYRPNECKCVCRNIDSKEKCLQEDKVKVWDPKECTCQCRTVSECSSGEFFSNLTCSCEQIHSTGSEVQVASNDRDREDYNYYKLVPNDQDQKH
ncbi:hypothetical protein LSTR_LSTR009398 [Laodelphax striatellus]|uniref:Platelet-derived growth factor (PDGF) family profile domain-containing protein n=1 Tax=Laodelphax striatellus TaxID=195883 RepID=A0A482WH59_LAOST|nr:hypothetical protein LSTR_LSTR009398 [Laodelphax striatellus]